MGCLMSVCFARCLIPICVRSRVNKGIGVENVHFLGDGLWLMERLEQR